MFAPSVAAHFGMTCEQSAAPPFAVNQ